MAALREERLQAGSPEPGHPPNGMPALLTREGGESSDGNPGDNGVEPSGRPGLGHFLGTSETPHGMRLAAGRAFPIGSNGRGARQIRLGAPHGNPIAPMSEQR
jgi:hypothetical protein